jgi:RNA-splicing ligase RtcB
MRRILISLVAAGAALGLAAPASAQVYRTQPYPGYGNGYGYGYGNVRALQARINGIQRQVENLRARRMITRHEASDLRDESRDLERRLYRNGRNGLNYHEVRNIEYRIARLEQHVNHEVRDGNRRGWNGNSGWNGNNGYIDHDRDGRNDRYEDDRGRDHDD